MTIGSVTVPELSLMSERTRYAARKDGAKERTGKMRERK
jgi:hypothetical protein